MIKNHFNFTQKTWMNELSKFDFRCARTNTRIIYIMRFAQP